MNKLNKTVKEKSSMGTLVQIYISLVMLVLPLAVTDGFYNITETKSMCFYVLSILLLIPVCVNALLKAVKKKSIRFCFSVTDIAMLIFAIVCIASAALSSYQKDVWVGEASRYQGALTLLMYVAVYFAVSRNYSFAQSFILCAVGAFSLVSLFGVLNCFDTDILGFYGSIAPKYKQAYISTIGNVNFYSAYFCLIFPFTVCGFCQTTGKTGRIIYALALFIGSFGMMVTSSDSFVVGFLTSMLLIPLLLSGEKERLKRYIESIFLIMLSAQIFLLFYTSAEKKNIEVSQLLKLITSPWVTAVILLICSVAYFLIMKRPKAIGFYLKIYRVALCAVLVATAACFSLSNTTGLGFTDKLFRITDEWGTYRGEIWKQCIEVYGGLSFKDKLIGIGPEALYRVVEASEVHKQRVLDQAHNEYLQYLLTTGVVGLSAYLCVIVTVAVSAIKRLRDDPLAVGLIAGLISYWVQASVNIAQPFTTPIMFVFIYCIGGSLYNKISIRTDSMKQVAFGKEKL